MVLNGALAGLISITAEPLEPSFGIATLIVGVGGKLVAFTVPLLDKFKIDDVVAAIPFKLIARIWGTLVVVLSSSEASFMTQIYSILIIGFPTFTASFLIFYIILATVGLRSS